MRFFSNAGECPVDLPLLGPWTLNAPGGNGALSSEESGVVCYNSCCGGPYQERGAYDLLDCDLPPED